MPLYQCFLDSVRRYVTIQFGYPSFGSYCPYFDEILDRPPYFPLRRLRPRRGPHVIGYCMRAPFKSGTLVSGSFLGFATMRHAVNGIWEDLTRDSRMDEEGGEWDEAKAAGSLKEFLKAVVYQGPLANRTWKRELCDCSLTQPCQVRWPDEVGEGFVGWGRGN